MRLVARREVAHRAADGVLEAGLLLERPVDVEEAVIERSSLAVE